ncbi:MAG: glycosyltransferase family 39 protein [Elusimicrobiota bacterium]
MRLAKAFPAAVWLALAAAWLFRIWLALVNPEHTLGKPFLSEYHTLGLHLARDGFLGFDWTGPSAFRLPLYPILVAGALLLSPDVHARVPIHFLNIVLSSLTILLTYRLALRFSGERRAVLACWLTALNPALGQLDLMEGPEPLYATLLVLTAWALVGLWERPDRAGRWGASGLLIGLSLLCRSTMLAFPFLLIAAAPWLLPRSLSWKKALLLVGCSFVVLTPWVSRNWARFGRIILFEDGMGWHSLYQSTTGVRGIQPDEDLPEPFRTYFLTKDPRVGPVSKEAALRSIRERPLRYAGYCVGRLRYLWLRSGWAERTFRLGDGFHEYRRRGQWLRAGTKALFKILELAFVAAAAWGMLLSWRTGAAQPLVLMVLYMNIHVLTIGDPRYTMPVLPLLAVFAAWGMSEAARLARGEARA